MSPTLPPSAVGGLVVAASGTDIWGLHQAGAWLVIPTNRQTRSDGTAVMGAGLAKAAAQRWPDLPFRYGVRLACGEDRLVVNDHRLLLAPTKDHWRQPSSMRLVEDLIVAVARFAESHPEDDVVLPAPGCGLGGLCWDDVFVVVERHLFAFRVTLVPPLFRSRS